MATPTNQALIDAIDQAIAGNTSGITSYRIGSREVTKMSLNELLDARSRLAAIEARKTAGAMFSGARMGRAR